MGKKARIDGKYDEISFKLPKSDQPLDATEVAHYIHQASSELASMAAQAGLDLAAYLLGMVRTALSEEISQKAHSLRIKAEAGLRKRPAKVKREIS